MKKIILILIMGLALSLPSVAQKDINAWKEENNLELQYDVFKENLNFWNGNYFLNETQLNQFFGALRDSVEVLENEIDKKANRINELENELNLINNNLANTQTALDSSIKNQNAIEVLGMDLEKGVYTLIMSLIILALLVILAVVFLLYKRSNTVTVRTRKDYNELKQEFETHKKNALDRYTKINTELHNTRMQLKNR